MEFIPGARARALDTGCLAEGLVIDDDTAPLPELSRFFTWGSEDEPAPYAPHRDVSQPEARSVPERVDVVPVPAAVNHHAYWRRPAPLIAGVAAVLIALMAWGLSGNGNDEIDTNATPTSTPVPAPATTTTAAEPLAIDSRLSALLPPGYRPGDCRPAPPPPGAAAVAECGPNAAAPGTSARYTLFNDSLTLRTGLNQMADTTTIEVCPGNFMSPGAWRRTAAADGPAAGIVVCGTRNGSPTIGWTLDEALLLAVIGSSPTGISLPDLYAWWSTHS